MRLFLIGLLAVTVAYTESMVLPENFTADFTQIVTNPKKKIVTYKGKIRFSDQSMLKWSYNKPTQKEVCVAEHELSIVEYNLEQVTYMKISEEFDFVTILKNAKLHHENVYVSKYNETSYTIQVDEKKKIHSVAFFDNFDNKVQIVFKQVKYGKGSLKREDMVCAVPQDFDIIR